MKNRPHYDVVLVQPNITWVYDPFEHLGLAYLTAALRRAGFKVKIVDAVLLQLSMSELYEELDQYDIDVLGVTLISHGYLPTVKFLECYREHHQDTKIVAGGHFATFAAEKIHRHTDVFDAIVLGEGEEKFAEYCNHVIHGKSLATTDIAIRGQEIERSHHRITTMDELPFPARDNLELAMQRGADAGITASRGCYAKCAFCTVHNFYQSTNGPRWMARSIENVISELETLHEQFDLKHFLFIDDNFMGPGRRGRERAIEFARAYGRSGLPMTFHIDCRAMDLSREVIGELCEVGLNSIFVGIESVAAPDLVSYRKGLKVEKNWEAVRIIKSNNLAYTLSMIMFNPETDRESILENVDFLHWAEYYPRNPMAILNLYEGTDLCDRYRQYMSGPFWDYRFEFAQESTREIYQETMVFCRNTLPLERELSRRSDFGVEGRRELRRLRLLFLESITRDYGVRTFAEVHEEFHKRLEELAQTYNSAAPCEASKMQFGKDRLYMTGSPLDGEPLNACPSD